MRTIAIPQLYCGASGKKGAYNRQEVGLARAFAALGCRAVVLYPDPDAAPEARCGYRNPTLSSILATQMPCRSRRSGA